MRDLTALQAALAQANVIGFLRVIREGESSQAYDAYTLINGGAHFSDFSRHPYAGLPTSRGGKAAGAYQYLPTTWDDLVRRIPGGDFSPAWQDLRAVQLIDEHGALDDVLAGNITAAIAKLTPTWTSLPGATENSGRYTLARALQIYQQYGGSPATTDAESKPMVPLLIPILGSLISELIPQVAKLFDGSDVAKRNTATAGLVIDTVVKAANAVNAQDAVEKMTADPALAATVRTAVMSDPAIAQVLEVGGGIVAARAANMAVQVLEKPFWFNPAFWITLLLLTMVYLLLVDAFFVHPTVYSENTRTQIVTGVLGILMVVAGYWLGSSMGSSRKTEISATQPENTTQ